MTLSRAPRPSAEYGPSGCAARATAIAAACSGVSDSGSVTGERDTVRVMAAMVAAPTDNSRTVGWGTEASGCLVTPAASKADVAEYLGQAGSIPVRLRQEPQQEHRREPQAAVAGAVSAGAGDQPGSCTSRASRSPHRRSPRMSRTIATYSWAAT